MTDGSSSQKLNWNWPLSLESYDRCPDLYPSEVEELDYWVDHNGKGYGVVQARTEAALSRLIQPINDAIAAIDFPTPYDGRMGLQLILLEMRRRRTSFWAWNSQDWKTIIGKNHGDFYQRFQKEHGRQYLLAIAYVLVSFMDFWDLRFEKCSLANKVFGKILTESAISRILKILNEQGYEVYGNEISRYRAVVCEALLLNRSPYLEDLTKDLLETARKCIPDKNHKKSFIALSIALERLGIIDEPIQRTNLERRAPGSEGAFEGIALDWVEFCQRWWETTDLAEETRNSYFYSCLAAGRWLAEQHPETTHPNQWTHALAATYVGAVNNMVVGQYSNPSDRRKIGKPISAWAKSNHLAAMRTFFCDCQNWEWIAVNFSPHRGFKTPRSVQALCQPSSRQIDDAVWAKLLNAGLALQEGDLQSPNLSAEHAHWYPIEMIRAVAVVWLFCGLRKGDIRNLRVGCIRWLHADELNLNKDEDPQPNSEGNVCVLDVPPGKTGVAFSKPVDAVVGQAIQAWERIRPPQAPLLDRRTSQRVHYLFAYRSQRLGDPYLNNTLIPCLCEKAGVPINDVVGKITSHRARGTILTQLSESMTIPELQSWSGHKELNSLQHYLKLSLKKQAEAYKKTDYFKRNQRTFEVLIDREAIKSGTAAQGEPWQYYDVGDGYCTYDFFEECPHRMACPQCSFHRPKSVVLKGVQQGKKNLQKMLIEIEMTADEKAALEEGVEALDSLYEKLSKIPTPGMLLLHQPQTT